MNRSIWGESFSEMVVNDYNAFIKDHMNKDQKRKDKLLKLQGDVILQSNKLFNDTTSDRMGCIKLLNKLEKSLDALLLHVMNREPFTK